MVLIDFRYHIVSIIAVFLALGLGILMGTTVADRVTVAALEGRVNDLSSRLDSAREDITTLRSERDRSREMLTQLSPWAVRGVLTDRRVLIVGAGEPEGWQEDVRAQLGDAGADVVGSLRLSDKWRLSAEGAREELEIVVRTVFPEFEGGDDASLAALELLATSLFQPQGRDLLRELGASGFVAFEVVEQTPEWPPADTAVGVMTEAGGEGDPAASWLATFARAVAIPAPTLVVARQPGGLDAVNLLREDARLPPTLSTFDSAGEDPTGTGAVLALEAAIRSQGGHFGTGEGLPFVPSPGLVATPSPETSPAP